MPIRALFVGMMPNRVQGQFAITKTAPAAFAVGLPPTRPRQALRPGFFRLACCFRSASPRPRHPGDLRRTFHGRRDNLPSALGDSFRDEITDPLDQSSRALVRQNAALDCSLRQRP
jgi:hypothetical protein